MADVHGHMISDEELVPPLRRGAAVPGLRLDFRKDTMVAVWKLS